MQRFRICVLIVYPNFKSPSFNFSHSLEYSLFCRPNLFFWRGIIFIGTIGNGALPLPSSVIPIKHKKATGVGPVVFVSQLSNFCQKEPPSHYPKPHCNLQMTWSFIQYNKCVFSLLLIMGGKKEALWSCVVCNLYGSK